MVAMNPQTWDQDVALDRAGRLSVLRQHQADAGRRSSATTSSCIGVPLTEMTNKAYTDPRQRQLFKNIVGLGALSALLDMDVAVDRAAAGRAVQGPRQADRRQRAGAAHGPRLGEGQHGRTRSGCACARPTRSATASSSKATPPRRWVRCMAAPRSAPGIRSRRPPRWPRRSPAIAARIRVDKATGKNKFAIVQAEDELASIGMVIGAAWNGARAFTATSGPGISLMQEFIGLAYFAEIPAVIFDVQRVRPVHRHADAHAADRHPVLRLCLARRHQARAAVPGRPVRVLRVRRAGVRPGRPAADADLRHARSRDRHERAAVQAVRTGTTPASWTAAR